MYLPGDTLTDHLTLTGPDNAPILGATFPAALRLSADPNGAPFPATVREVGQGVYEVSYTLPQNATPGEYFLKLRADDPDAQVFTCRWEVISARRLYIPGDTLTHTFVVLDYDNNDVLGATFPEPQRITTDPLGQGFPILIEELGLGCYRVVAATATTSAPGTYYVRLTDDTPAQSIYEIEWQLLSKAQAAVVYTPGFSGHTRRDIRREVLSRIGDLLITTATKDSGSSTWTDEVMLVGEAGTYAGREVLVTSGTPSNVGQVRYVSGSNRQFTMQFSKALPFPVFAGDEAEIINTRGGGFRFQQVHQAINACLAVANVQTPLAADIADAFDRDARTIPIPSEFNELHGIQYRPANALSSTPWANVKHAKVLGDDGWAIDHANRTLAVGGNAGYDLHGATIRLYGLGKVAPLVRDDDMVDVNLEWLSYAAAARLLLTAIGGPRSLTPEWERKGNLFQQEADRLIDRTRPRRKPNTVKL